MSDPEEIDIIDAMYQVLASASGLRLAVADAQQARASFYANRTAHADLAPLRFYVSNFGPGQILILHKDYLNAHRAAKENDELPGG